MWLCSPRTGRDWQQRKLGPGSPPHILRTWPIFFRQQAPRRLPGSHLLFPGRIEENLRIWWSSLLREIQLQILSPRVTRHSSPFPNCLPQVSAWIFPTCPFDSGFPFTAPLFWTMWGFSACGSSCPASCQLSPVSMWWPLLSPPPNSFLSAPQCILPLSSQLALPFPSI